MIKNNSLIKKANVGSRPNKLPSDSNKSCHFCPETYKNVKTLNVSPPKNTFNTSCK